jgi:hypothetical protein
MLLLGSSRLLLTLNDLWASLPQVPVMRRIRDQNFIRPPAAAAAAAAAQAPCGFIDY